jgi:uncharacterized protein YoxC
MMSLIEVFVVAAVVLLAVLVGAAVPPLFQLRSTLKSVQTFLDETRPRLEAALDQATEATTRVNRAAAGIEEGMAKVRGVFDAIAALGETLENARESLRKTATVMSAIAPAIAAGFRAVWPAGDRNGKEADDSGSAERSKDGGRIRPSEEAS